MNTPSLQPLPYSQVRLADGFWAARQETNRRVTIPHIYQQFVNSGYFESMLPTWKPGSAKPAHVFYDSDWGKWLEAASYSLALHPDPELAGQVEDMIARLAALQQPDGYLNSHFTLVEPHKRWSNLRDQHELYCAGHLTEAAVAHFQATGSRALLEPMLRYTEHIASVFGPGAGQRRGYPGHPELELALVRLYRATGERRYLQLSQFFVEERGRQPHYYDQEARARGDDPAKYWAKTYAYCQAHLPLRQQENAVGHAVRALYLYAGATDIAQETQDADLLAVLERLFASVERQLYLTGGIGPAAHNEGFTGDYDLPNEKAYAETCAAIALFLWMQRMLSLTGQAKYADLAERALFNGILSGVSLSGDRFFYENPLAVDRRHHAPHRQPWYDCACCPPNIARLLASLGGYLYASSTEALAVCHYASSEAQFSISGQPVRVVQQTDYPWRGSIHLSIYPQAAAAFTLQMRLPAWSRDFNLTVNRQPAEAAVSAGWVQVQRAWQPGDTVELALEMPIERVYAHPQISANRGRVALQRGPLVYCLEGVDNGDPVDAISLPRQAALSAVSRPDLLGGVVALETQGQRITPPASPGIYHFRPPQVAGQALQAVPYYAWDQRAAGDLRVWIAES